MSQNQQPSYLGDYQGKKVSQTGGPFAPGNSSTRYNLGLLILIFPALLTSILGRSPAHFTAIATLIATFGGTLLGTALGARLFTGKSEKSEILKLNWIVSGIFGWLLFFQFGDFKGQLLATLGHGLAVGFINSWPRVARCPGFPILMPTLVAGGATTLAYFTYLPSLVLVPTDNPTSIYPTIQSGWVVVMAVALVGGALGKTLLAPSFSGGIVSFSLGKPFIFSLIISLMVFTLWFWYGYQEGQPQGILADARPTLILALLPAAVVAIFWLMPPWLIWRGRQKTIHLHSQSTSEDNSWGATNQPIPTGHTGARNQPIQADQPTLRCGHLGTAPKTATWEGFSSCALAASHDLGFLLCPYGCLGLGDCSRSCPTGAIIPTESGFPIFNKNLCSNCGNCLKSCPKNLWVLASQSKKVFIPCAAQSSLKKNAAYCEHSCLGCGKCRKACPAKAIIREGAIGQEKALVVNQEQCLSYGESCQHICASVCPRGIMTSKKHDL